MQISVNLLNSVYNKVIIRAVVLRYVTRYVSQHSTAEYQHATKDANFSAQESLDERRRYALSPQCLFREETFHASNKHDSWNIRN